MKELLIQIYGPHFLIFFSIYSLIVIYLTRLVIRYDHTRNLEVPEPTKLTSLDIAILRRGIKGAINHSLLSLWHRKALNIDNSKKKIVLRAQGKKSSSFTELEKEIYQFTGMPRYLNQLMNRNQVKKFNVAIETNMLILKELFLFPDSIVKNRYLNGFIIGLFLIVGVGGFKLHFGMQNDKPVGILIVLLIVFPLWLLLVIKPYKVRITHLGIRFLKLCNDRFEWVKSADENKIIKEQETLLWGAAIFGLNALDAINSVDVFQEVADIERKLVHRPRGGGYGCAGCGGGCSGGCSGGGCSGSGSYGGGGCSSGCGGGGCGGCGGD